MAEVLYLPKLGVSMQTGIIAEWLVENGATVEKGQAILVVASDKTETEIEAPCSGTLVIEAQAGEEHEYPVGTRIGEIKETSP